jgi:hypothetical protein
LHEDRLQSESGISRRCPFVADAPSSQMPLSRRCPLVADAPRTEHDREIRSVGVVVAGEIARW